MHLPRPLPLGAALALGVWLATACGDGGDAEAVSVRGGEAGRPGEAGGSSGKGGSGTGAAGSGGRAGREAMGSAGASGGSPERGGTGGAIEGRGGAGSGGDTPDTGAAAGRDGSSGGTLGQAGEVSTGGAGEGGQAEAPGACHDLVNDGPLQTEWTVDGWFSDDQFTAPLEDLPGERDLYALFVDTGVDGSTGRHLRSKVRIRDMLASPARGTFDVVEQYDDGSAEQRGTYTFTTTGPSTARVELAWLCGDRLPFFENYAGVLTYVVDFQVVFTRDASGAEPMISRDYRTRGSEL